jgi:hypothetical protein
MQLKQKLQVQTILEAFDIVNIRYFKNDILQKIANYSI